MSVPRLRTGRLFRRTYSVDSSSALNYDVSLEFRIIELPRRDRREHDAKLEHVLRLLQRSVSEDPRL